MALIKISEPNTTQENEQSQEVIVGIDLGTTNSLIAAVENKKVKFFTDENDTDIIPSLVNYNQNGILLEVGKKSDAAIKISSIKRLLGKSFFDVKNKKFDFEIIADGQEKSGLKIKIAEKKITPTEISAEILKYLKNCAEKNLKTEIKKAVITVPAYFDEAAKNATKFAANLAGLEVLRLISEPTAAALAYGLDNSSEGIYCVYDLGGGTFDVSILKMQKGVFKVLGVSGDNNLGGDDFDLAISEKLKISKAEARKIKEELSTKNSSQNFKLEEFEKLIGEKIEKTFTLTKNLITDLELENQEIEGVILVGGSTRIPLIKKKLAEIFGDKKIFDQLDPDRIVAAGAAWQAYNLSGRSENLLLDVVPLSLGIEMMGGIVDKIILRNSTIPISVSKEFTTYADNQTAMKLHIVQGEREFAKDCRSLAEFEIKRIPAMKAGLARVIVNFKVDADGLLTVLAQEKSSGEQQEIIVKPSYGLDENEVKKMLLDSLQNSKTDIANRILIQTITDANHDIAILKKDLASNNSQISQLEKNLISDKIINLERLISEKKSRDSILEAQEQLTKAATNLVLEKVNSALKEKVSGKKIDEIKN